MSRALPVGEALASILQICPVLPAVEVPYTEAGGRVLQEPIRADQDYPGFEKAMMDGFAVRAADLRSTPATLRVIQEIPAGTDPGRLREVGPGQVARIMTGAPLPPGADAVLMVEETTPADRDAGADEDAERVICRSGVEPGANVARRGEDVRAGQTLLEPGDYVGAAEIAVLAACGRTRVRVGGRPRVAVLATGDELVPADRIPGPGRIRNSNGPLLVELARRAGAETHPRGIAPDRRDALRAEIEAGLQGDMLLLSGGVSMGRYDLVGETLQAAGVTLRFEAVAIKPGRPFTFGHRGPTLVFGCPGNPVSSYVIFQIFARPALRRMMGFAEPSPLPQQGVLTAPVRQRGGRDGYYQARARFAGAGWEVTVLPTTGSADFVSCARGNALAILPADARSLPAGASVGLILLDDHADR
jgi:molybdopterin molybdotransferase